MPDNDTPFEPLLSKSLCSALLDISKYFGENADQMLHVRYWVEDVLVEARTQPEIAQPEIAQPDFPFAAPRVPTTTTTVKAWKLP